MIFFNWFKKFIKKRRLPFDVEKVEASIGYHFNDPQLLFKSLKHRSYSQTVDGNISLSNERLEFLGDSVLNMVVSTYLFNLYPDYMEGDLTKIKSNLVSKKSAAVAARNISLERFVLLNDSEENAGGRTRTSIAADTFEAVIGAVFIDGGYDAAKEFIERTVLKNEEILLDDDQVNYKSLLLEYVQAKKMGHPVYVTVSESGPDHDKIFTVDVFVNGKSIGRGTGKSKKSAQQMSAKAGLEHLNLQITVEN